MVRMLSRIVKINFVSLLKIKTGRICWTLTQEIKLNLCKYSKLWGVLIHSISNPTTSSIVTLKTNCPTTMIAVKTSSLEATGRDRRGLELPQSPIPKHLSLFKLHGSSLKSSIPRTYLYLSWLRVHYVSCLFKKKKKKISGNYWPLQLSEVVIPIKANNSLTNRLRLTTVWPTREKMSIGRPEKALISYLADLEALGKQEVKAEAEL